MAAVEIPSLSPWLAGLRSGSAGAVRGEGYDPRLDSALRFRPAGLDRFEMASALPEWLRHARAVETAPFAANGTAPLWLAMDLKPGMFQPANDDASGVEALGFNPRSLDSDYASGTLPPSLWLPPKVLAENLSSGGVLGFALPAGLLAALTSTGFRIDT
ncbi:MAG: hypothetical protein U0002_08585 [Thermoanaerobaculia bacterium]